MPGYDALHGRQTDARALVLGRAMQALKGAEQLADVGTVESHAVVSDEVHPPALVLPCAELYRGLSALARKLPRVPHQVLHDRPQHPHVAVRDRSLLDGELHPALRTASLELLCGLPRQRAQVYRLPVHLGAGYAR